MLRLWNKINKTEKCWLWTGTLQSKGYGQISINGKGKLVHRLVYELLVGKIPEGLQIDHLCKVRHCVNPAHLEPVTQAENMARSTVVDHNLLKTHCPRGHEYDEGNTKIWKGHRSCRECRREQDRSRYWHHKKAQLV